ncbi:response regulator, partial [Enterococcus faecalis]|uniref:response regulator n=1 Tax=Enterococcus faecalis TaxID=1351 RepID=UPI00398498C6
QPYLVLADLGGAMSAQHVLIVEDSLVYRRLLSRMLTQWGYIVSEAENGVAALAILENQPPERCGISHQVLTFGNLPQPM